MYMHSSKIKGYEYRANIKYFLKHMLKSDLGENLAKNRVE